MDWLHSTYFYKNSVFDYAVALAMFLVILSGLEILKSVLKRRIEVWANGSHSDIRDLLYNLISHTYFLIILAFSLFMGTKTLELSDRVDRILSSLLVLNILLQVIFWGNQVIEYGLKRLLRKREVAFGGPDTTLVTIIPTGRFVLRLILIVAVVLLALANLGVDITALVAGLGVGGLAVALAVQNVLGDLFASLSIVLDKPFEVGDNITVGGFSGVVERIGLKTTRLRSSSGELLIYSNAQLLSSQIQNFKKMSERRCLFEVGVTYETPVELLKMVPEIIKSAVEAEGRLVRFERTTFKSLGSFSLNFEVIFFVQNPEMAPFMECQERVNFRIFESFQKRGIAFAYPTQTLFMNKVA